VPARARPAQEGPQEPKNEGSGRRLSRRGTQLYPPPHTHTHTHTPPLPKHLAPTTIHAPVPNPAAAKSSQ
jgi:hypothetical protein